MSIVTTDLTASASPKAPMAPLDKQTATSEGSAPEEVTKETQADPMASKFAALARQQKAIRDKERAVQAEKQAYLAEKETLSKELAELKAWKAKLRQEPLSVLSEEGVSYDQLTNLMLNQPSGSDLEIQKLSREIEALKAARESDQTQSKQAQDDKRQEAVKQIENEVTLLIDGNEAFETIQSMNAQKAVVELIERTFDDESRLLTVEEAANEVEEYLVEQAMALTKLKKIQSKMNPAPAEPALEQSQTPQKPQQTTLSNRSTTSTRPLTAKERRERAIAAFKGQLT